MNEDGGLHIEDDATHFLPLSAQLLLAGVGVTQFASSGTHFLPGAQCH